MPASPWRATTSASSRGGRARSTRRARSTSGRSGCGAAGGDPERRLPCGPQSRADDARSRRARPRRRAAPGVARGVAGHRRSQLRTPRPWRAWRRWPPHGRRAPPPPRCTARRRRSSTPARSRSTRLDEAPFRAAESALRAALGDERFAEAVARGRALGDDERRRLVERVVAGRAGAAVRRAHQARARGRAADGGGPDERRDRAAAASATTPAPTRGQHPVQARRPLTRRRGHPRGPSRAVSLWPARAISPPAARMA